MFFCIDLVFATNSEIIIYDPDSTSSEIIETIESIEDIDNIGNVVTSSEIISTEASTRVITNRSNEPDITANVLNNDFIVTHAVIDPLSKGNIETFIVKNNVPVSFYFINGNIVPESINIQNYYYRTLNNRTIKIRCRDYSYTGSSSFNIIPDKVFNMLKAINKLDDSLFIHEVAYKTRVNNSEEEKTLRFAFKIVTDQEYNMYKNMEEKPVIEESGEIKRPKKVDK